MEKPTSGEKFRALLATGRVANLPTVWSNVLVGFWIASSFVHQFSNSYLEQGHLVRFSLLAITIIVAAFIYVGGCMLGDAQDIEFDRTHRPDRPIPRGILSRGTIKFASFSLLTLAIFGLFISSLLSVVIAVYIEGDDSLMEVISQYTNKTSLNAFQLHEMVIGLLLAGAVITYAYNHKKNKIAGLMMMASCRFLLVILAIAVTQKTFFSQFVHSSHRLEPLSLYSAWIDRWMIIYAAIIGVYTLLLSWVASTESQPGSFSYRKILGGCMLLLPFLSFVINPLIFSQPRAQYAEWSFIQDSYVHSYLPPNAGYFYLILAMTVTWILLALKKLNESKPAFVSRALAGFCLIDATIVAAFSPLVACICVALFALALLLQRITPAT
ncbi:MAG: UbiA family prenyltransferase [Akkermansiaceae bacterium]